MRTSSCQCIVTPPWWGWKILVHPAYANGFNPISEFLKPGMTSPSIALGGKLYGSWVVCEACMTLLSATEIVFIGGPRVGSPDCSASFVVMKSPVATVSKMPMDVRDWYYKPMIYGVSCVEGVYCRDGFLEVYAVYIGMAGCWCGLDWWGGFTRTMICFDWCRNPFPLMSYAMKNIMLVSSI